MTGHETALEAAAKAYAEATGYYVPFHAGLSSDSANSIRKGVRSAISAYVSTLSPDVSGLVERLKNGPVEYELPSGTVYAGPDALHVEAADALTSLSLQLAAVEGERNLFKGKYRALLKLISRTRSKLVLITDHIEDEGDRRYFGSTNHADELRELYDEMMRWIWDATDETNRMKSDPYTDIRKQRARAETAEASLSAAQEENERLRARIENAMSAMNRCEHDGGFDREIGPIGCDLGDKCVCIGVYPALATLSTPSKEDKTDDL